MVDEVHEAAFGQDVGRQQQLGVVGDMAEAAVNDGRGMAEGHDEQAELFRRPAVVVKQGHQSAPLFLAHLRQASLPRLAHDERHVHAGTFILEYRRYQPVLGHDADGHQAVEPRVGGFLRHVLHAMPTDGGGQ